MTHRGSETSSLQQAMDDHIRTLTAVENGENYVLDWTAKPQSTPSDSATVYIGGVLSVLQQGVLLGP